MKKLALLVLLLIQGPTLSQTRPGSVAGEIRGLNGQPAANIRVSVMEAPETPGTAAPALVGFAQTDSQGHYRIDNVPPGRYYILAGQLESPTYYPGAAERSGATAVSVVAGATLSALNFSLSPDNQNGIIQVVVQALGSSTPIAGAEVNLRRAGAGFGNANAIITTTDATGQVTIGGLTTGQYNVTVQSQGFVGPQGARGQTSPTMSAAVTITGDQKEQRIVFPMKAGSSIEGRVRSSTGQPIANAAVTLHQMGYQEGRRVLVTTPSGTGQTEADGRYAFTVGPGEYYIRVQNRPAAAFAPNAQESSLPAYYPGVLGAENAKPVLVRDGDRVTGMDVILPRLSGFTIAGTVINRLPGGRTTANGVVNRIIASLSLVPRNVEVVDSNLPLIQNIGVAVARRGGSPDETPFEIHGVPPGDYDLYPLFADNTQGNQGGSEYFTARTPITVRDKDTRDITITLQPNLSMNGRFVVEGNVVPIAWDSLRIQLRPKEYLPTLVRGQGTPPPVNPATRAFSFTGLPETTLGVVVNGLPATTYVADIRQGTRSIYAEGIDTRKGSAEPIEIVLRSDSASVQGTVQTNGAQRAVILARPAKSPRNPQLYKRGSTAPNSGQFTLTGLAPGDYVLYALPGPPQGGAEENDEFMKKYEGQGRPITLTASETARVELTVINDPSLVAPDPSGNIAPQISNGIVRLPNLTIVTAESLAANPQPGARGGRGRGTFAPAPAPPAAGRGARGARGAAVDRTLVEQNLARNPQTPLERIELIDSLMESASGLILNDKILAERIFKKVQELDPKDPSFAVQLAQLYGLAARFPATSTLPLTAVQAATKSVEEYEKAIALGAPPVLLPLVHSEMADMARLAGLREKSQDAAHRAIATKDPDAEHRANTTLGLIALAQGDVSSAKKYLLASADVARSPVLGSFGPDMELANELLRKGERDTVTAYLERCLLFMPSNVEAIKDSISSIKNGQTPTLRSSTGR